MIYIVHRFLKMREVGNLVMTNYDIVFYLISSRRVAGISCFPAFPLGYTPVFFPVSIEPRLQVIAPTHYDIVL